MRSGYFRTFIAAAVISACFGVFSYAEEDSQVIRVGYYEGGDFMHVGSTGEYEGFNFEFLYELAKYTGWEYDIVEVGNWQNAYRMLENNEIDILPAVYYTEERSETINFPSVPTALPLCSVYTTLNVREDDLRYNYADYKAFSSMKVGVIQGSKDAKNFTEYCQKYDIRPVIVLYKGMDELLQALDNRELDAAAITQMGKKETYRSVAKFSPEPLYIGVAPDREELLNELNESMEALRIRVPDYEAKLYEKYFSVSRDQKPVFTNEELEYIKEAGTVKAIYNSGWPPFEEQDPDDGTFTGITAELFQDISDETGLRFTFIPVADDGEGRQMLADGTAQIDCGITGDYLSNRESDLNATEYYLSVPMVMITNGTQEIRRMAVLKSTPTTKKMMADHEEIAFTLCSSFLDCFDMLKKKEVDALFTNTYTAEYFLSQPKYRKFTVSMLMNYAEEFCIGVSRSADSRLFSILDKCVLYTSSDRMNEMILNHSIGAHVVTLEDFVLQNPIEVMLAVLAAFLFVTAVLIYFLLTKSRNNMQIQKLMYLDPLTGMWNLNKFRIEAEKLIKSGKQGSSILVYTDIKQFKTVNDTLGFEEGDELLCLYAKAIKKELEQGELYGRVAADQFVLLLHYDDWAQMEARVRAIDERLHELLREKGKKYFVILCFGAYIVTEPEKNISWMLDLANYARRSIKTERKTRIVLYDENMREQELFRKELSDQMERALEKQEFVCYFQPKVNMVTRKIIGSEALVRWNHPEKGLMYPGAFIPYFEQNGFVVEIDLYMYEEVCRYLRKWMDEGRVITPVSCNFSRLHFKDEAFSRQLISIADRYQVPYNYLELELTEGMWMESFDQVINIFTQLKEKGFIITIDDFGTGYSSLGLLQRMPVDVIKLDRSFLSESLKGTREKSIIRCVVNLADDLKIEVICEGVETENQAESLVTLGCFNAQGFYYARPVPADEFEEMLMTGTL